MKSITISKEGRPKNSGTKEEIIKSIEKIIHLLKKVIVFVIQELVK